MFSTDIRIDVFTTTYRVTLKMNAFIRIREFATEMFAHKAITAF